MARGKQTTIRVVEDVPVYMDGEPNPTQVKLIGLSNGRVRFDFDDEAEAIEVPIDELIDALIYLDPTGQFAQKVLEGT